MSEYVKVAHYLFNKIFWIDKADLDKIGTDRHVKAYSDKPTIFHDPPERLLMGRLLVEIPTDPCPSCGEPITSHDWHCPKCGTCFL